MNNPFDFFDKIYYLNLDEDIERKILVEQEFNKNGILAERVSGVKLTLEQSEKITNNGGVVCDRLPERLPYLAATRSATLSHLNAIALAKYQKFKNVLIFEDDVIFTNNIFEELNYCLEDLKNIEWDMFILGCNPVEPFYQKTKNLSRCGGFYMTHAYVINHTFYDKLLNFNFSQFWTFDQYTFSLARDKKNNIFMSNKNLVSQRAGTSSAEGHYVDYTPYVENNYKINFRQSQDISLGIFYQSGNNLVACYFALNQFRKFYPDSPIALYEDNSDLLQPVADIFNCVYAKTKIKGKTGRPAYNLETTLAWLDRLYEACTTTLKNVDYVMHFEDDVWIKRKVKGIPPYDLSGITGFGWDEDLYKYLNLKPTGVFGCGGSIFNREKFIDAYEKSKTIDWELINKLSPVRNPSEWTDSALTLVFAWAKHTFGFWEELLQYRNPNVTTFYDRTGWPGTMEELEQTQPDCAAIHCWKPYYFPTEEEITYVNNKINERNN